MINKTYINLEHERYFLSLGRESVRKKRKELNKNCNSKLNLLGDVGCYIYIPHHIQEGHYIKSGHSIGGGALWRFEAKKTPKHLTSAAHSP